MEGGRRRGRGGGAFGKNVLGMVFGSVTREIYEKVMQTVHSSSATAANVSSRLGAGGGTSAISMIALYQEIFWTELGMIERKTQNGPRGLIVTG